MLCNSKKASIGQKMTDFRFNRKSLNHFHKKSAMERIP
jgi:hypothetical protein